ncbi:MAG: transcriptional regulator [Candidatus Latescibacteria bacterium]|nr:transcriptional regulator [Candidatus Latescibacterota bacterium]MBT4140046.1 transcriptional regulator [Candidatus Latescibacterota bacterium]
MPRSYGQFCSLARALDVVGERWTLLVIRDLLGGPKRYKDLVQSLSGIGTNLLANRLKELEAAGLVKHTTLPPPASVKAYDLTKRGRALEPAVVALADWGLSLLDAPREDDHWLPQWNAIAFKARFDPEAAKGVREIYAFVVDGYPHYVVVDDGTVETFEGVAPQAVFTLMADRESFLSVIEGEQTFEDAIGVGDMILEGDVEAFARCGRIFER